MQIALTNFQVLRIDYSNEKDETSTRAVEPFALISTSENWLLIAWCRLRKEFRYFRLDRITRMEVTSECFEAHKMTLQGFFDSYY